MPKETPQRFVGLHWCWVWKQEFLCASSCRDKSLALQKVQLFVSDVLPITASVEYVKRRVWLAQRLSWCFICCQRSMSGLQSMTISFMAFSLLLCCPMHHPHQYDAYLSWLRWSSTPSVQTEMSQQLFHGQCGKLMPMCTDPRGWTLMTMNIPRLHLQHMFMTKCLVKKPMTPARE